MRRFFGNIFWELRVFGWSFSVWPSVYVFLLSVFRRHIYSLSAHRSTDVVVEGFPRSANTYLVEALKMQLNGHANIAHHLHDVSQLTRSEKLALPCFVIIRNPVDAVVCWKLKSPQLRTSMMFKAYKKFYDCCEKADHITLLDYNEVINNTSSVVGGIVGSLCDVSGSCEGAVKIDKEQIFSAIDLLKSQRASREKGSEHGRYNLTVARPTAEKEAQKKTIESEIMEIDSPIMRHCMVMYENMLGLCVHFDVKRKVWVVTKAVRV